jgi:proline racemase
MLFMHNDGYATMSGHGIIAATTIALERGLLTTGGGRSVLAFDTPAGTVRARAEIRENPAGTATVERVAVQGVPSFVLRAALPVTVRGRRVRADVAYGGAFYAIVDSEAIGLPLDAARLPELRRAGLEIREAIEAAETIVHPLEPALAGVDGAVFTAPPGDESSALKSLAIFAGAAAERSPGGTVTAAVMAVVDAMGLIGPGTPFVLESLIGSKFTGRVAARTAVGESPAIVAEVEGSAWITGEHMFVLDDADPFREGFRL